jgi:hypothetical protein
MRLRKGHVASSLLSTCAGKTMNYRLTRSGKGPPAVTLAVLLTFALLFCLAHRQMHSGPAHNHHGEAGGADTLHGICGGALTVAFLASSLMFLSMSWWLLTNLGIFPSTVSLHLPDPPPKSPALL